MSNNLGGVTLSFWKASAVHGIIHQLLDCNDRYLFFVKLQGVSSTIIRMSNRGNTMRKPRLAYLVVMILILFAFVPGFAYAKTAAAGPGVGNVPQGTQTDSAYANSFAANKVTNVFAT